MSTAEPPRLLVIAESLDVGRGGQERSVVESCAALARRGMDVRVLAGGSGPAPPGCGFEPVPAVAGRRSARLREFMDRVEARIAELRPTHLVQAMIPVRGADLYLPRSGLFPEIFRRNRDSRPSAISRSMAALALRLDRRRRLLLARETAILRDPRGPVLVALSDYVARSAERHYGLGPPRVRIVRNGVDVAALRAGTPERAAARAALGVDDGTVVFLAAAHNFRLKGIAQLVQAARLLPGTPAWTVLVAGRGRPVAGAPSAVRWLGGGVDRGTLLGAADVVVHPTFSDPSSRIVLEALALGRPVVTTRWNGAADFAGEAGAVIDDPRDVDGLARAMARWLDPGARAAAARATRGLEEKVSVDRHAAEMAALLGELRR